MRAATLLTLFALPLGCAQLLALDDYDQPSATTSAAGGTAGAAAAGGNGGNGGVGAAPFSVPPGWTVVVVSDDRDVVQPCTGAWTDAVEGGRNPQASGEDCMCSCQLGAGSCPTAAEISIYQNDGTCTNGEFQLMSDTSCLTVTGSPQIQSAKGKTIPALNVMCAPSVGGQTTASWGTEVKTCSTTEPCSPSDCPQPPAGYRNEICIMHDGAPGCDFGEEITFYEQLINTTSCLCSCDDSTVVCTGTTTLYGNQGCSGAFANVTHDDSCMALSATNIATLNTTITGPSGDCSEQPPEVVGTPDVSGRYTVCCVARE